MKLGPRKGIVFIVSAPSGGGKTTLMSEVLSFFPGELFRIITCTTRLPRVGEVQGEDYQFLSEAEFETKRLNNEFLECTKTFDHSYGTLKSNVDDFRGKGNLLLVIDVKGAESVMRELNCVSIFIAPPSLVELERRIRQRMQDDESQIKKRLMEANIELKKASLYDYNLVNDDFSVAVEVIKSIIIAESFRRLNT